MNIKLIVILSILTLVFGSAGYAFYLGKDIIKIKAENYNGDPVPTLQGFEIPINVLITNPSKISIPIKSIEYVGVLEETGETLTSGRIENVRVTKLDSTWVNTTAEAKWDKTLDATSQLLLNDHVWVNVKLNIDLGFFSFPYSTRIDIKDALSGKAGTGLANNIPTNTNLVPQII